MPRSRAIRPISNVIFARESFFAPVERLRQNGTPWVTDNDRYHIEIDDALTEKDRDIIEWLLANGQPGQLRDGSIAFRFSICSLCTAVELSRARVFERFQRRQKTLLRIDSIDGAWSISAQVFGALTAVATGVWVITLTPQFASILRAALQIDYSRHLGDILRISSPVVRHLVREVLSHDERFEGIERILERSGAFAGAATPESRRKIRAAAMRDVLEAADYLAAVFGIEVTTLKDGSAAIRYTRDHHMVQFCREPGSLGTNARKSRDECPEVSGRMPGSLGTRGYSVL